MLLAGVLQGTEQPGDEVHSGSIGVKVALQREALVDGDAGRSQLLRLHGGSGIGCEKGSQIGTELAVDGSEALATRRVAKRIEPEFEDEQAPLLVQGVEVG